MAAVNGADERAGLETGGTIPKFKTFESVGGEIADDGNFIPFQTPQLVGRHGRDRRGELGGGRKFGDEFVMRFHG